MKQLGIVCATSAAIVLILVHTARADPVQNVLAKFSAAWTGIRTYQCTATSHEVKGAKVQDRVYVIKFSKPLTTRVDVVAGDGRGSAAVWSGGSRVHGHQGGLLGFIKLNVDLHSRLATSIRGTTIAQANWGALLTHLKALHVHDLRVTRHGGKAVLTAQIDPLAPDTDVAKELYVFGADGLPVEVFQYSRFDAVVKHVVYSDVKLNLDIPASAWQI